MRYRLTWLLAGVASVVVIAGVAALWRWEHSAVGISVGIPVAATLLAPLVSWAFSAQRRSGQPTPEQTQSAKQAVADFALEQWRRAAKAEPAWCGGAGTLEVHWIEPAMKGGPGSGAGTVATIAARLRDGQSCRLVVLGPAGSGKTTLARLLVTELLKPGRPDDQVPVLLPVSAWDPDLEGLHEWMVRWIADEVPGLGNTSNYGPAAVANLVNRGMVLPILDGLDVLPEAYRRSVLSSGDLLLQNRFVLTCRTDEFRAVSDSCPIGAVVLTADRVPRTEMMRFLHQVTERPRRWNELFGQLPLHPSLADALSDPRIIYLVSIIYKDASSEPGELISLARRLPPGPGRLEDYLLKECIHVRMPLGACAAETHWEGGRARKWLTFLADLPRDESQPGPRSIAWWQLYRAVPWLCRRQALVRAFFGGLIAWLVVIVILKGRYGQLTGLAYGLVIFTSCWFLSSGSQEAGRLDFRRPAWRWWITVAWLRSRRVLGAGVAAFCSFSLFIGLRVALTSHLATGIRAGAANGLVAGMIVILAAVIARIPTPPRGELGTLSSVRPKTPPIGIALVLGVLFGLFSGLLAVHKHQGATGPNLRQALIYGLIMGLDFGVGTWLVRWAQARFANWKAGDPLSDFHAERAAALLVPIILGITFSSAFGLSAELAWNLRTGIMNGMIGIIVGIFTSDMSLYVLAVACLGVARKLPFRAMKFLEYCRGLGILRPALQRYQFSDDPDRLVLPARQAG